MLDVPQGSAVLLRRKVSWECEAETLYNIDCFVLSKSVCILFNTKEVSISRIKNL